MRDTVKERERRQRERERTRKREGPSGKLCLVLPLPQAWNWSRPTMQLTGFFSTHIAKQLTSTTSCLHTIIRWTAYCLCRHSQGITHLSRQEQVELVTAGTERDEREVCTSSSSNFSCHQGQLASQLVLDWYLGLMLEIKQTFLWSNEYICYTISISSLSSVNVKFTYVGRTLNFVNVSFRYKNLLTTNKKKCV